MRCNCHQFDLFGLIPVHISFYLSLQVISKGQVTGPSGVTVNLYKTGSKDILQTVKTTDSGR